MSVPVGPWRLSPSPKPERAATALRTTAFIFSAPDGSLSGCHEPRSRGWLLLTQDAVVVIGMVVEVPLPNDRAGQTIAPRVSSSQPPLVLAWRTNRAVSGRLDGQSDRDRDRVRRSLSRVAPGDLAQTCCLLDPSSGFMRCAVGPAQLDPWPQSGISDSPTCSLAACGCCTKPCRTRVPQDGVSDWLVSLKGCQPPPD